MGEIRQEKLLGYVILGIDVIDINLHECMMLKAVQTKLDNGDETNDMSLYDWYAKNDETINQVFGFAAEAA